MVDSIINLLRSCADSKENERGLITYGNRLVDLKDHEVNQLLSRLVEHAEEFEDSDWDRHMMMLLSCVPMGGLKSWLLSADVAPIVRLYRMTDPNHVLRCQLLAMVIGMGNVSEWIDLICNDPPQSAERIDLAFAPVVGDDLIGAKEISHLIEHGTANLAVAAPIYELANREYREKRIDEHPAKNRLVPICELTGSLIARLGMIEEGSLPANSTPESVAQIVQESVALAIALIDTMALLDFEPGIVKMNQAVELKHRRIQVEAAAGMARLDDEAGKQRLVELAQHPVIRPRVIAYAKEVGIENQISLEHRGAIAQAESELAIWLSLPDQMGLAPSSIRLVEQRELFWPSYDDPVPCYLFEFEYGSDENAFRNIGINGPLTHAFSNDIRHLDRSDQFSAFAGWQTLSNEIYLIPVDRAKEVIPKELGHLNRLLEEHPFKKTGINTLASFFEKHVLIADGTLNGEEGTMIVEDSDCSWFSQGNARLPIDWHLAFDIWKGRKLLSNFNSTFES